MPLARWPPGISRPGPTSGCGLERSQRGPPDEDDAGRHERPVPPEFFPRHPIGRDGPRLGAKDRHHVADRIGAQRPGNLHVVSLGKCRELVRRNRPERHVRLPRLRDGADDDLAIGNLVEDDPPDRGGFRQQSSRAGALVGDRAQEPFAGSEDRAHDGQLEHLHLSRRRERDRGRCDDARVMPLGDLVGRHEAIEQRIVLVGARPRRASVPRPRDQRIRAIGRRSRANSGREPLADLSCARCPCHVVPRRVAGDWRSVVHQPPTFRKAAAITVRLSTHRAVANRCSRRAEPFLPLSARAWNESSARPLVV